MYKKGKDQLSCSPHLKVKQPLLLIINAWALCRARWNDIKNTVVHCADCCSCEKALALAEFGRGIWNWSRLALSWKLQCVFANWRGGIITRQSFAQRIGHMPLVCDGSWFVLKLWRFLWPLSRITKFSGTPASSRREIDVLRTEWLDIVLFWAAKPAFFAAVDVNFPISFLPSGELLYQTWLWRQV